MDTLSAPSRPEAQATQDVDKGICSRSLLWGTILVELAVLYVILNGGGWVYDDNLSLELARNTPFGWHWLLFNLFGHWEIAHRAVFSLQVQLMPLDYRWALVGMLLMLGVAMILFERVLRMLLGEGWMPLLATAYFGISVLLIRPLQWWSSGLESFPTLVCDLLCTWAYLHYHRQRRTSWITISAGAIAVGLLFYEKPIFMPLYLLLIRAMFLSPRRGVRSIAPAIWEERPIWIAYLAVIVVYAIVRDASGAGSVSSGGAATLGAWVRFLEVLWAQTLAPAMFGLVLPATSLSAGRVVEAIALQAVILAAVIVSVRRRSGAWLAWASLAICVLATGVLLGASRLGDFGPTVGGDPRYLLDFSWLVPLFVALAFSRRRAFVPDETSASTTLRLGGGGPPRSGTLVAVAAVVLYGSASIVSAVFMEHGWPAAQARRWEQNLSKGLYASKRKPEHLVVADEVVPYFVVSSAFPRNNKLSLVLPLYVRGVQVDGPELGPLMAIDPQGNPRRAIVAAATAPFSIPRGCGTSTAAGVRIGRSMSPALAASRGPYYLRVTYTSAGDDRLPVYVDHGGGYPPSPQALISLSPAVHQSIQWLGGGPVRGVAIQIFGGMGVCVRDLQVVTIRAAA